MKRTGEILKNEREARGLSLHEIGLSLKINSKILKAIENGDSANLPAKTFLRGFVQSYASYLKLNVDDVLKVFADEMGTTRPQSPVKDLNSEVANEASSVVALMPQDKPAKKEKKTSLEESSTTKGLIFSLLGVILAGLILVTMKVIDRYQREAQVTAVDVKPIEAEKTPLLAKTSEEKFSTAPVDAPPVESAASVGSGPAPTLSMSPSSAPALKTLPVVALVPKEVLPAKPVPIPEPKVVEPKKEEVPQEKVKVPEEKKLKPIELIVEALDSVEIEYAAGAGKIEKIKLEPEQIHTFKSKAGLKLTISNGGAVNMILNGKDLGVPGDLGKSIKLNY